MDIGMLWFDNDPKTALATKVERAASYYRDKYGKVPTLCFVHPSMLPTPVKPSESESSSNGGTPKEASVKGLVADGIEIRSNRSVLPHHFWIGVNGKSKTDNAT